MSIQSYPLYDQLVSQVDSEKSVDLDSLVATIKKLPSAKPDGPEHCEEIMALIYHHSLVNNDLRNHPLPYGGRLITDTRGVTFDCQHLPASLTRILDSYLIMHS